MASRASLKFIEIAANLTDDMFKGIYNGKQMHPPDIGAVLARAWEAGVQRIIVTGGSLKESREALALADTDARLFCTVGVHPTRCMELESSPDPEGYLKELKALAKEGAARGKVVAIGECGLDYDRLHFCGADVQQRWFERQFEVAEATNLPMFLHMRAATDDFLTIVERNKRRFSTGVVHSFTGSAEDCDKVLASEQLFIGINGCSLKTDDNLSVMSKIPVERLMLETDSPYCEIRSTHAGVSHVKSLWSSKKKEKYDIMSTVKNRNEPCHIRQVLEVVTGCKGETDVAGLAQCVFETTCRVFFPHDLDTMAGVVLGQQKQL